MAKDFSTLGNTVPLGLRNNNPGNIRASSINWKGQIGVDSKGFVVFRDISYGIRAFGKDISAKINRGLDTLNKIIPVYAPPSENNTIAYINSVSKYTGITPTQKLSTDRTTLAALAKGFFHVELGTSSTLITPSDILEGLQMLFSSGSLPNSSSLSIIIIFITITLIFIL